MSKWQDPVSWMMLQHDDPFAQSDDSCHLYSPIVPSIHFVPFNASNSKRNWVKFGVEVKLIVILRHIIAYFSINIRWHSQNVAYLIPERNRTVRRQEEGKNSVYLFVFLHELGGNKCFINHFLLSDETFWLCLFIYIYFINAFQIWLNVYLLTSYMTRFGLWIFMSKITHDFWLWADRHFAAHYRDFFAWTPIESLLESKKKLVNPSFKLSWEPLICQQQFYRRKIPQQCYRNWRNLSRQLGNFLLAWAGQFAGIKNQTMHRFEQYLKILQLCHENSRFLPSFKFEA
jgi:hypothetical protein